MEERERKERNRGKWERKERMRNKDETTEIK
jgi:hypothetical protein